MWFYPMCRKLPANFSSGSQMTFPKNRSENRRFTPCRAYLISSFHDIKACCIDSFWDLQKIFPFLPATGIHIPYGPYSLW